MGDHKVPTGPGRWWRDDCDRPVNVTIAPYAVFPALWWQKPGARGPSRVTDDGHWLAPVLTVEQAAALTQRAERAEHTLAMVREATNALEWIGWRDLDSRSTDEAHGMNVAGWRLRVILNGGDHE